MPGFHLYTSDRSLWFKANYGAKAPAMTGGGPILDVVPRPNKKSLTEWAGREPMSLELSFYFDEWDESNQPGMAVEKELRELERMMGIDKDDPQPPEIIVRGIPRGSVPHDVHDNSRGRWWVEAVTYEDDRTLRNDAGNRIRVFGTIKLTEVSKGTLVLPRRKRPVAQNQTRYRVKKGDTLMSIAKAKKVKGGWRTLAKLNKIRDPRKLKVGSWIKLK